MHLEKKLVAFSFLLTQSDIGPCHVSGIFLPLRVNSLPLATIYEVKIPLRQWKKSLLQRNPAQMTWAILWLYFGRARDKMYRMDLEYLKLRRYILT
jgi:hypothetical protein